MNDEDRKIAKKLPLLSPASSLNGRPGVKERETGIHIIPDYKSCMTPWGYSLQHGASILAYQQDFNTPDTCKIERRFCRDGELS